MSVVEKLWTLQQLAEFLGVPEATVYQWRSKNYGPRGLRVGKHVRYRPSDVEMWLASLAHEVA